MHQNTCVGFKVEYVDAKSDAIAFCVRTYPSDWFIKNRTNMHETQNRMKVAFCVKPPLPSILLGDKGKFSGGGLSWRSVGTELFATLLIAGI